MTTSKKSHRERNFFALKLTRARGVNAILNLTRIETEGTRDQVLDGPDTDSRLCHRHKRLEKVVKLAGGIELDVAVENKGTDFVGKLCTGILLIKLGIEDTKAQIFVGARVSNC